jgi:hypothetical protein
MNVKNYLLAAICLCFAIQINAQETPKTPAEMKEAMEKNGLPVQAFAVMPTIIGVSAEYGFGSDKTFTTFGDNDVDVSVADEQHYSIYGSVPIFKTKKGLSMKLNFDYDYFTKNIDSIGFNDQEFAKAVERDLSTAYASLNLSQKILIKKWKKHLVVTGSFSIAGEQYDDIDAYGGTFGLSMPLIYNAKTVLSVGVQGIFGDNVQVPVIPTVAYFTKLSKKLNLEIILPVSAQLRFTPSAKTSIAGGFKLGTQTPYMGLFVPSLQSADHTLEFRNTQVRTFLGLEQAFGKMIWLNLEVGYNAVPNSTVNPTNIEFDNNVLEGTGFGNGYVQLGLFLRPVFPPKKKK